MADFREVFDREQDAVSQLRRRRNTCYPDEAKTGPTAICLSGGGIRSATFCLGVLQGLATYGLLKRFDYISSVSGGGYISSWLISWIKRPGDAAKGKTGVEFVEEQLSKAPPHFPKVPGKYDAFVKRLQSFSSSLGWKWDAKQLVQSLRPSRKLSQAKTAEMSGKDPHDLGPTKDSPYYIKTADGKDSRYEEPGAINFLRAYSNYLTPRVGFFGVDTWVAIASFVRNLLLNQAILFSSLAAFLLLPHFAQLLFDQTVHHWCPPAWTLGVPAIVIFLAALTFIDRSIADCSLRTAVAKVKNGKKPARDLLEGTGQGRVLFFAVAPVFGAAVLGAMSLTLHVREEGPGWYKDVSYHSWLPWILWTAAAYVVARGVALIISSVWLSLSLKKQPKDEDPAVWGQIKHEFWVREAYGRGAMLFWAIFAGGLAGFLLWELARLFNFLFDCHHYSAVTNVVSFGPPLFVLVVLLAGVLHVGLMGEAFVNEKREWWARVAAWLLICILGWAFFFAVALFVPPGLAKLASWTRVKSAALLSWLATTLYGVLAGKSSKTSGEQSGNKKFELVTSIAPYVFILGTVILISYANYRFLAPKATPTVKPPAPVWAQASGKLDLTTAAGPVQGTFQLSVTAKPQPRALVAPEYWNSWCLLTLLGAFLGLGGTAVLLAWRVDVNEFSLHLFYRNRLVRCYLGATNPDRCPQPFTGFDPSDDILLRDFATDKTYSGPYPIFNAALNFSHGQRLAWQERKAESFVFTPDYCGYDFQEEREDKDKKNGQDKHLDQKHDSYQATGSYAYADGGPYLGTAMAISGAAVNPNMGYHASAAVAFLLTVFNVRLGWWMGNPRRKNTCHRSTPEFGLFYLLSELFGMADDTSGYVNLSDGWHFENLGLYELVRRKCKYIVVCDVGADYGFGREDLGNAVRKCRSDLGAEIEIDAGPLRPDADGFSKADFVTGTVTYPGGPKGIILYIKSALTGNEPQDVLAYKVAHKDFPHQSTGDQWFNESQFESYRALGRFAAESAFNHLGDPQRVSAMSTRDIFEALSHVLRS